MNMARRKIVVIQNNEVWIQYLSEAFEDTSSRLEIARTAQEGVQLVRSGSPDFVFGSPRLITPALAAAIAGLRSSNPAFRCVRLGPVVAQHERIFDAGFDENPPTLSEFQKCLSHQLTFAGPIRLLVVDDEEGIGEAFREYFEHRNDPGYIVQTAGDGIEAKKVMERFQPSVLVLDIKMPGKDGRALYRELIEEERLPATIVFFDVVSVDEVIEIRRRGSPAFVEKGSRASSMPEMAALIKKVAYFG